MDRMTAEELESDINSARNKLRNIDDQVTTLSGRVPRRISYDYNEEDDSQALNKVDRRVFGLDEKRITIKSEYQKDNITGGAIRRRISIEDRIDRRSNDFGRRSNDIGGKRQRPDYLDDEEDADDDAKRPKRSIQSTVVMPVLDSKGREEKIEKLKESENKEVKNRNRRMFSNLLMGTLNNFKRTEKKTQQQEKQEEVEKKLAEKKELEESERKEAKHELLSKRRQQEFNLRSLQRKKALGDYANEKIKQYELMKGAIRTKCTPVIFWQPVKNTPRSLELQMETERYLDEQINKRREQYEAELSDKKEDHHAEEEDENEGENDEYEDEVKEGEDIEIVLKDTGNKRNRDIKIEDVKDDVEEDVDIHVELD